MPAAGEPEAVQLLVLDAMAGEAPAALDAVALPPKVDKVDAGLTSRTAPRTGLKMFCVHFLTRRYQCRTFHAFEKVNHTHAV